MAITDTFTRADGGLGSNWTALNGSTWAVVSNQAECQGGNYGGRVAIRSEASFPNDHYAQVKCLYNSSVDTGRGSPIVRGATGPDGYVLAVRAANYTEIHRLDNGAETYLGDGLHAVNSADTLYTYKITATGSTIAGAREGTQFASVTDSTYGTGAPGMYGHMGNHNLVFDDFESTDATASGLAGKLVGGKLVGGGLLRTGALV